MVDALTRAIILAQSPTQAAGFPYLKNWENAQSEVKKKLRLKCCRAIARATPSQLRTPRTLQRISQDCGLSLILAHEVLTSRGMVVFIPTAFNGL